MYDTTPPPAVIEYAEAHGYTHGILYRGIWNDFTVYMPNYSFIPDGFVFGLPSYILTKGDIMRWADVDERDELIRLKY